MSEEGSTVRSVGAQLRSPSCAGMRLRMPLARPVDLSQSDPNEAKATSETAKSRYLFGAVR
jgi:hypothetical protein